MAASKRFGCGLLLLVLAFPAAAGAVFAALARLALVALAHPSATFAVAAALLLASTLPGIRRHHVRGLRRLRRLAGHVAA